MELIGVLLLVLFMVVVGYFILLPLVLLAWLGGMIGIFFSSTVGQILLAILLVYLIVVAIKRLANKN